MAGHQRYESAYNRSRPMRIHSLRVSFIALLFLCLLAPLVVNNLCACPYAFLEFAFISFDAPVLSTVLRITRVPDVRISEKPFLSAVSGRAPPFFRSVGSVLSS